MYLVIQLEPVLYFSTTDFSPFLAFFDQVLTCCALVVSKASGTSLHVSSARAGLWRGLFDYDTDGKLWGSVLISEAAKTSRSAIATPTMPCRLRYRLSDIIVISSGFKY